MHAFSRSQASSLSRCALVAAPLLLAGCASLPHPSASIQPLTIAGSVHGGQQPVAGARIYIYQASGFGYGGGSYDLIAQQVTAGPAPAGIAFDSQLGAYYITSAADGSFSLTGDYRCTDNRPVYLLATHGNPGLPAGTTNPALAELAVLGPCPPGSTLPTTVRTNLTELTTVAGVFALSGYMTAPNQVSSRTDPTGAASPSDLGLNAAALTALALLDPSTGAALPRTAAGGTVSVAKLNLLANLVASCINSDGTTTACTTLFMNATADGTPTGTRPTDTVTALLNIAHHPGTNVTALAALATANSRFQPALATLPTDLALSVTFPLQVATQAGPLTPINPALPTVDAQGDIIVPGLENALGTPAGATVILNNLGKPIATASRAAAAVPFASNKWALDQQGYGWSGPSAAQLTPASFARLTPATGAITLFPQTNAPAFTTDIAISSAGNIYLPNPGTLHISEYSNTGAFLDSSNQGSVSLALDSSGIIVGTTQDPSTVFFGSGRSATGGGLNHPSLLAADNNQGIWVANGNNSVSKFLISGADLTPVSPTSGYTGGGLAQNLSAQPLIQIVMDGLSNAWLPNYAGQSVSAFSNAGQPLSPAATSTSAGGFSTGCNSKGLAIDPSGNVWVTCDNPTYAPNAQSLVEFIGLAAPVSTPILPNRTGTRP